MKPTKGLSARWGMLAGATLIAVGLGIFDPIGWDRFGPIRWALMPALGFAAVAMQLPSMRFSKSPVNLAWAFLLGWGALASIFAADPLHAWIGTPDRRFGWLTWLLCGGLFLMTRSVGGRERRVTIRGFVIGSLAIGAYLVGSGLLLALLGGGLGEERAGAQFGQPAYLGAAATLALPICIGLAGDRRTSLRWRSAAACGALSNAIAVLASGSRAAWLATATAGALWVALNLVDNARVPEDQRRRDRTRRRNHGLETGLRPRVETGALLAGAGCMALAAVTIAAVAPWRERLLSITDDGGVLQGRLDEWQVGLRALLASPVTGYGPEGYRTVFGAHVDERYVIDWGRTVFTDRAHNAVLDVGLSFGIPGAIAYLAILAFVWVAAVGAMRRGDAMQMGLAVGVIAYGIQLQFLFPLSEVDPLFWMASGLVMAETSAAIVSRTAEAVLRGLAVGLAMIATIAGGLDLVANARLADAIDTDRVASVTKLRPDSTRYHFIAARVARDFGDIDRAIAHIDDGLRRSPNDPAVGQDRGHLLLQRARSLPEGPERERALALALQELEILTASDPNNPQNLQWLGIAQALTGRFDPSIRTLERAIELAPTSPQPRLNLDEALRLQKEASG